MNESIAMDNARYLLREWLFGRLDDSTRNWISDQIAVVVRSSDNRNLYKVFALMGRKLSKGKLELSMQELAAARQCLDGWTPCV